MKIRQRTSWPRTYHEAVAVQNQLRQRLVRTGGLRRVEFVAGADVSYDRQLDRVYAGIVVLNYPDLETVESATYADQAAFPYVPGLLTFREGPVLMEAFRALQHRPDVIIFDGQGYAHPRRMGLASHMGVLLGIPSVGCAKSRLTGEHAQPGQEKGNWTPLMDAGERIGRVVRTRTGVKPVYVSVGHLIGLTAATNLVLACVRGFRLPEPTRRAHQLVTALRKKGNPSDESKTPPE